MTVNAMDNKYKRGHLELLDALPWGSSDVAGAVNTYADYVNSNKRSANWLRAVSWIENTLFGMGRQYVDNMLVNRISSNAQGDLFVNENAASKIPKPTNDLLGRYIETNISLLTENRPIPRVTAKSDSLEDKQAAMLSEMVIEFLWEELEMPEKHRELARMLLYCGVGFLETCFDPFIPRHMSVPLKDKTKTQFLPNGIEVPVPGEVIRIDPKTGQPVYEKELLFGDISSNVISPFEIHIPNGNWWNGSNMGWIMKETYCSIDEIKNKYLNPKVRDIATKKNGYNLENVEKINRRMITDLPLWWWNRLSDMVEGPSVSMYGGTPELWEDYTTVRVLDRKPSYKWPKGRTVILAGDQVIYDSPKNVGARAFDERWSKRWHPYTRYRWESQLGSMYGRSMVSKLLPKLKRINSIDAIMIMWRRTVPISQWIFPKGTAPVEMLNNGEPGSVFTYDPARTRGAKPEPVYPSPFPAAALEERQMQINEMESIAGTEQILRGERPVGVNSAAMFSALRNQALASRSAILQAWDESLQWTGSSLLQETIKHIKDDPYYADRINLLAREKSSQFSINQFSGQNLQDNVIVRIDTASMAFLAREARQERAMQVIQYGPNLAQMPTNLQAKLLNELGWPDALVPSGPDINRARAMLQFIKSKRFDLAIPMPEDDPYVMHDLLVVEIKNENFFDLAVEVQMKLYEIVNYYRDQIKLIEQARMQQMLELGAAGQPQV